MICTLSAINFLFLPDVRWKERLTSKTAVWLIFWLVIYCLVGANTENGAWLGIPKEILAFLVSALIGVAAGVGIKATEEDPDTAR